MRHAHYQGRHRQQKTTKRRNSVGAVSAVGVGAVAATVLAPAAAANAATDVQWERVAHCESRDNWHINTGNGYYGGLQFAQSTWHSYDVDRFADRADLASRREQIVVANRVLASQGWGAWPVCSRDAGDPGPTAVSHLHRRHHRAAHKTAAHKTAAHKTTAQKRKIHKTTILPLHGSWVRYRVQAGDSLSGIATDHAVKGGWYAVYTANRHKIGSDPGIIHSGLTLRLHAHTA